MVEATKYNLHPLCFIQMEKEQRYNNSMKDLTDYVVYQDGKFWVDTEDENGEVPFVVGEHFIFDEEGSDCTGRCVGVVECDDGVDEFAMIPFRVVG